MFFNADTRTGVWRGNRETVGKSTRLSLGIISTDVVSSRPRAEGKPPRAIEVPGGGELEEERSGAPGGGTPLLIETRKTESLQQRADLWGPARASTRRRETARGASEGRRSRFKGRPEDHSLLRNSICLHLLATSVHVGTCAVLLQQMGSCL